MTNLAYDESIGWYDPDEEYCIEDGCHKRAVDWELEGMVGDNMVAYAVCEDHSPYN